MTAKSEIWYYLESGHSPEESGQFVFVRIVIKDNSGQLWLYSESIDKIKQNLLNNRNYYIDAFNKGTYVQLSGGFILNGKQIVEPTYDKNRMTSHPMLDTWLKRLIVSEKTEKCYVMENVSDHQKYAFSFDFETMIKNCDRVNPVYYTSVPVDRFIVRRSIDDLF